MWSFGCVLSESATWVVLGRAGVKQFNDLRRNATQALTDHKKGVPSVSGKCVGKGDFFHDGQNVLPEIKQWHTFLRKMLRSTDTFSGKILDLIDDGLLVADPEHRLSASQLSEWFRQHLPTLATASAENLCTSAAVRHAISMALLREAEQLQGHLESQSKVDRNAAKNDPTYLQVPRLAVSVKTGVSRANSKIAPSKSKSAARDTSTNGGGAMTEKPIGAHKRSQSPQRVLATTYGMSQSQCRKERRYCVFHAYYAHKDKSLRDEMDEGDIKSSGFLGRLRSTRQKDGRVQEHQSNRNGESAGLLNALRSKTVARDKKLARYIQDRDLVSEICLRVILLLTVNSGVPR